MKRYFLSYLCVFMLVAGFAMPAYAVAPQKIGHFSYWTVYKMKQGKMPVCYMSLTAKPPKLKKSKKRRGDVTLMVTHRPAEGAQDVVSYNAGGRFKAGRSAYAVLGDKRFDLFTNRNVAWARDSATDHELSMALRAGTYVTFMGRLSNGKKFADTVNLKGSAKAYELMSKACGVQVLPVSKSARPNYKKK